MLLLVLHGAALCLFFGSQRRQAGGVFSPVLFCLYIDDLLLALSKSGVGGFIGKKL